MKVNIKYPEAKCKWCGNTYKKTHNRQQYCSDYCRNEAKKEQTRNSKLRHYYRNRNQINKTSIGTRTIGPHKNPNDDKEAEIVQNEIRRIGLQMF